MGCVKESLRLTNVDDGRGKRESEYIEKRSRCRPTLRTDKERRRGTDGQTDRLTDKERLTVKEPGIGTD